MRLPRICTLEIEAHCAGQIGWNGHGRGQVEARRETAADIVFTETGRFEPNPGATRLSFFNTLRWTVGADRIALSHLRGGHAAATRLVELRRSPNQNERVDLCSIAPHVCGVDRYTASLTVVERGFDLIWRVTGPRKHVRLVHRYRMQSGRD